MAPSAPALAPTQAAPSAPTSTLEKTREIESPAVGTLVVPRAAVTNVARAPDTCELMCSLPVDEYGAVNVSPAHQKLPSVTCPFWDQTVGISMPRSARLPFPRGAPGQCFCRSALMSSTFEPGLNGPLLKKTWPTNVKEPRRGESCQRLTEK